MKICYLTHDNDPGTGWGRYTTLLVKGVRESGTEAVILKERRDAFEGTAVLARGWRLLPSVFRARKHLKECDIIHALDVYPYGLMAYLGSLFLKKKLMITGQGTYAVAPLYNFRTSFLAKWTLRRAASVTAISNFTKGEMLKKVPGLSIHVINHGVDTAAFSRQRKKSDTPFILSVGALKERKGYRISIPAFARIASQFPGLKYVIIGSDKDSAYKKELEALAVREGISERVEFLSGVPGEDLPDYYAKASVFLLISTNAEKEHHFEGFGLVFLEAAAAGLPVIGTKGNGIEDAVSDGNGILVPQNDVAATAEALRSILGDEKRRSDMSDASYKWAAEHSIKHMSAEYTDLYSALLVKKNLV